MDPDLVNANSQNPNFVKDMAKIENIHASFEKVSQFINHSSIYRIFIGLFLCFYLMFGFNTQLHLVELKPIPNYLLEDFSYYERAVTEALSGKDPYSIKSIGTGFLYPPPAMLVVEIFSHIQPQFLKISIYTTANFLLMMIIVYGVSRYYGYSIHKVWYWYVMCLAFAPFLELLEIGQINVITMFGIFLLFIFSEKYSVLGGFGLGLAVVTKVTPLLFLVYPVIRKNIKVIIAFVIVLILMVCFSIFRYGFNPVFDYPDAFQWLLHQFPLGNNSQSLVARLFFVSSKAQNVIPVFPQVIQSPLLAITQLFTDNYQLIQRILTVYIFTAISISAGLFSIGKQSREPLFIITTLGMMLSPNILWYHHYVFILLPILIWMGWSQLDKRVVVWCCLGLLIIQIDRFIPPYGLFIHGFSHISLLLSRSNGYESRDERRTSQSQIKCIQDGLLILPGSGNITAHLTKGF